ncbi:Gfo/Idh/MocA family oxidoreductase [Rhizobium sp. KVB221]|uniref:Gfo/Idh/MocA family oxidoreductase n=1 Tax=Rhizobium setariae TaxID=2801340 RepID=A0A937CQX9_9HYPH|nr:Gfo/Idh/MocA family oxidoreductase [Rhizobium setariae]MBL0373597.1 Gfo/Idh/MocA family oxidoreductase [Rhizobium setariae]
MLRWGILGTSFISDTMAAAIASSEGSCIAAVAGRDTGRLQAFADRHAVSRNYTNYDLLYDDADIDIIYVGLPNNVHHEAVIKAAARGKPVLSEKSLTTTMTDAEALADAVRTSGIFFLEGLMYLSHPIIAELGMITRSGRLGTVRSVSGLYAADIWQVVNPQGNGTLFNLGCYPASLLHYVIQTAFGPNAFRQRATHGFGNRSSKDGNICDAALSVRFGNGVLATLQSTDSYGMAFEFSVYGDKGSARFKTNPWLPVAGDNVIELSTYDGKTEDIVVSTGLDAFQHQVHTVEHCLSDGYSQAPRPSPRLEDSLEIMSLLTEWEGHCARPRR